jgi:hypothetical protein
MATVTASGASGTSQCLITSQKCPYVVSSVQAQSTPVQPLHRAEAPELAVVIVLCTLHGANDANPSQSINDNAADCPLSQAYRYNQIPFLTGIPRRWSHDAPHLSAPGACYVDLRE